MIPRRMEQEFTDDELRLVLLHEKVHIRSGHLWFYLVWDLCQMVLWINPLFILCRDFFLEDLENICDRITIQRSGKSERRHHLRIGRDMGINQRSLQCLWGSR